MQTEIQQSIEDVVTNGAGYYDSDDLDPIVIASKTLIDFYRPDDTLIVYSSLPYFFPVFPDTNYNYK